jgi:integrase
VTDPRTRGKGTIYHRGDALWIFYYLGGERRESVGRLMGKDPLRTTWTDAVTALKRQIAQKDKAKALGHITTPAQERATVAELAKAYIAKRIGEGVKDPAGFRQAVGRVIALWGPQRATMLTKRSLWQDVERLLAQGLQRSTIKTYLAQFKAILVDADELLPRIPKFPALRTGPLRRTVWTEAELEAVCAVAEAWLADVLRFGYLTGWRISEVLGMTWDRVDVREDLIYLDESKTDEPRVRPISLALLDLTPVIGRRLQARRLDCPRVFHVDGHAITTRRAQRRLQAAMATAGITDKRFHDFRRAVADRLLLEGVGEFTVQEVLGHKSLSSTRRYTKPSVDRMRAAMDRAATSRAARLPHTTPAQQGVVLPFSR